MERTYELIGKIEALKAHTPAGLGVKVRAVSVIRDDMWDEESEWEPAAGLLDEICAFCGVKSYNAEENEKSRAQS